MAHQVFFNIGRLYGHFSHDGAISGTDMHKHPFLSEAWMEVMEGVIVATGTGRPPEAESQIDCEGDWLFPGFCDSHTHLIFAAWRAHEFDQKIAGASYEDIAASGGGILNSAEKLAVTSEEDLFQSAWQRLIELVGQGTLAMEIKTGYGLSYEAEMKMLRVAARLKKEAPIPIKVTLLGAHALPQGYREKRAAFVEMVTEQLIPDAAQAGLMDYVDVFCDQGFFTPEETAQMLSKAQSLGYRGKIHANELGYSGGIQVGVAYDARSVDHLEFTGPEELSALVQSDTIPTLLPGTAFFLRIPYPPARTMIDAGLPVALASDLNPGSCPSGNPWFIWSLACIQLRMSPEEALTAFTRNSAVAMDLGPFCGALMPGKWANFNRVKPPPTYGSEVPRLSYYPYRFAVSHQPMVYIKGNHWKA